MGSKKVKVKKMPSPEVWASLKPFGIGEQHPNNYFEIFKAVYDSRDELGYAWRIMNEGVCDGCALGTTGMKDWTLDGIHLCNVRLRLLRLNTMPAFDYHILENDLASLKGKRSAELRDMGRLPYPMIRRKGEANFARIGWDEALNTIADKIKSTSQDRLGFYLTSRGMPNEAYYVVQKAVRAMGTNSIDNAARICHSPSTVALKENLGIGATTCSYPDWIGTDLIIFFGANPANNQPVTTKYLHYAKKAGTKVISINNYREPGMDKYWVPSIVESALFGTKITDEYFIINTGGDIAFINGALKYIVENNLVDQDFIANHTTGYEQMVAHLAGQSWESLEKQSGVGRDQMEAFGKMVGAAKNAVLVWSMGITQHTYGEDGVRAIVNLALTKGFLGREKCGVMPIRGHSGVQGGAEMGAYSTALPGGLPITEKDAKRLGDLWQFEVPLTKGLIAPDMIDAGYAGNLDVLFSVGGNFLEVLPEPDYVQAALERIPLRVHMDIVMSSQMLLDPAETVILLPATTRYEVPGGVTETSTERRVIFSPEIEGRRIGEARSEIDVFMDLARRVKPALADRLSFADTGAVRAEIAKAIPMYDGIQNLNKLGDNFQYGGEHLCEGWKFPTPDGKAHFSQVSLPVIDLPEGMFYAATRRGKQFNSMIHEKKDSITGAERDSIFMNKADAEKLNLKAGDPILLRSAVGEYQGKVFLAPVKPGNLQIHWPEGNVVIPRGHRSPKAGIPDYNALVSVEKI